ncbi:hypothetical protein [Streptococcus dysgalactiae]|uniref:hypothetical protein n=1 Tax=Streptococcus dysgalactiae TaxID=1334 RepID=UPI000617D9BD|nr:hypothetical protein [Streptococcus dysgalactiae]KKC23143.1 hypothetical protein WH79_02670 [Streptococcus dysgalactiae subsp. equisimilis]QBX23873.1 hypothetical protein Javan166_0002 [Streptococcus phage Javan166]
MRDYIVFSLGELLEGGITEESLLPSFNAFKCEREKDLEVFLQQRAVTYDKSNLGKTSLIIDKEDYECNNRFSIMAFFTIGQTSLDIENLSINKRKKLLGQVPGRDRLKSYPAYLIGQLGRSDYFTSKDIDGDTILNECYSEIRKVQRIIGGRLLLLECRKHMFNKFYEKKGYVKLSEELDEHGLYTLYRKIRY